MPIAYKKIATATVGAGGVANVEFTSIDQTFTDLVVHACARSTRTGFPVDDMVIRFNGSTTGYNTRRLYAVGTGISNDNVTSDLRGFVSDADSTASAFGSNIFYIPNYTAATNKSVHIDGVGETNATDGGLVLAAGLWQNTAAITTIRLFANNGNLVQYSTFTLYGISKS
jgi:hypothetical protein